MLSPPAKAYLGRRLMPPFLYSGGWKANPRHLPVLSCITTPFSSPPGSFQEVRRGPSTFVLHSNSSSRHFMIKHLLWMGMPLASCMMTQGKGLSRAQSPLPFALSPGILVARTPLAARLDRVVLAGLSRGLFTLASPSLRDYATLAARPGRRRTAMRSMASLLFRRLKQLYY